MTDSLLWESDTPVTDLGIEVPEWIEGDVSPCDVAAIIQGGCMSGAYMPAVTHYDAGQTMAKHGDDVLGYIESDLGEIPTPPEGESWAGRACFFLSYAVELWALAIEPEVEEALRGDE